MIDAHYAATLYITAAFLWATPWMFNWATKGTMPVTVRLYAMFVFSMFLGESGFTLWTVHSESPDRMGDAVKLVSPMIFISLLGMNFVVKSLVKLVAAFRENNDKTD